AIVRWSPDRFFDSLMIRPLETLLTWGVQAPSTSSLRRLKLHHDTEATRVNEGYSFQEMTVRPQARSVRPRSSVEHTVRLSSNTKPTHSHQKNGHVKDGLRPFFGFYGGKWRDTLKLYPRPEYDVVIEPFAG